MEDAPPRQRWRTVLGILCIVFGCFGMLSALQTLILPKMLELQRKMFESMPQGTGSAEPSKVFSELFQPLPSWFTPWSIMVGLVSVLIFGFYILGAIWLLVARPSGARLLSYALIASMVIVIVRSVVVMMAAGGWGLLMGIGAMFGVAIDAVLLVALLTHRQQWQQGTSHDA